MEHYIITGSVLPSQRGNIRSKPLTYLSSPAVFEHLEANTRCLLATHCPSLLYLHSRLPLKIAYLKLGVNSVQINDCVHKFQVENRKIESIPSRNVVNTELEPYKALSGLEPGSETEMEGLRLDPVSKWHIPEKFVIHYIQNNTGKQEIRKIPGKDTKKAQDILLRTIFLRTPRPIVDRYEGFSARLIRNFGLARFKYPFEEIKFQVKEFVLLADDYALNDVFGLNLPLLHSESFPLKKLSMKVENPRNEIFQNGVLKNAKCVDIGISDFREWYPTLSKLNNETVTIRGLGIYERLIVQLAQNLFNRDIGTVFNVISYFDDNMLNDFYRSLEGSTGMKAQTKKVDGHKCSCYSLDFNKELNIYYKKDARCLVMKVMKAESAI